MSFSWSAPQVTPEQETLERESLTVAERSKIVNDIYGHSEQLVQENAPMIRTAISETNMHLYLIPPEEKEAYLEALERCPELVASESSCIIFLRAENFNPEAAALRLVNYWTWRHNIFGELAFLPMTQQGALSDEVDRLTLSKGLVTVQGADEHGRPVIHYHRSRMDKKAGPRDSILRVIFFVAHTLIMGDERASKNGVIVLANFNNADMYPTYDRILSKKARCILEALTMLPKAVHMCLPILAYSFLSVVIPVVKQISGRDVRLRMLMHVKSGPGFIEAMEPYGVSAKNIPSILGGAFRHEDYLVWLRQQDQPPGVQELAKAA